MTFEDMKRDSDSHIDHVTAAIKLVQSLPPINLGILATLDTCVDEGSGWIAATYRASVPGNFRETRLTPVRLRVPSLMTNGTTGLLQRITDDLVDDLVDEAPQIGGNVARDSQVASERASVAHAPERDAGKGPERAMSAGPKAVGDPLKVFALELAKQVDRRAGPESISVAGRIFVACVDKSARTLGKEAPIEEVFANFLEGEMGIKAACMTELAALRERDGHLAYLAAEDGVTVAPQVSGDKPTVWDASYPGLPFCGTGPDPIEALVMLGLCQGSALKGHRDTIDQLRALLDKAGIAYPGSQPPGEPPPGATDLPDPSGPPGTVVVQKDQTAAALFVNDGGKTHADGDTTGELAPPLGKSKGSKAPPKA